MKVRPILEPLVNTLEEVQGRIQRHSALLRENETRTRRAVVDPLLDVLGWDTEDPSAVVHEFKVSKGWVDYALVTEEGDPIMAIEAKKLGEPLEPHRTQMVTYANIAGIPYCGLTNGDRWEVYDVFAQKPLEEKCILRVSIVDEPFSETAIRFILLWKANILTSNPAPASTPLTRKVARGRKPKNAARGRNQRNGAMPKDMSLVKLSDFKLSEDYPHPKMIRFPDRTERELKTARQLVIETAEWLYKKRYLVPEMLPIHLGNKRKLVVMDKEVSAGAKGQYKKIPGSKLLVLVNLSSRDCHKAATMLANECNLNPDQILVM